MAEGDGVLADGTELWLTNESGTLTKIKGLMNVNRPNLTIAKVESTDHDSGAIKRYIPGHGDVGELQATIKYRAGSDDDLLINEHLISREYRAFKLVTPSEDGGSEDHEGSVLLLNYVPDNAPLGGIRTATLSGQPAGLLEQAPTPTPTPTP